MSPEVIGILSLFSIGAVLTLVVGFYSLLMTKNLIRTLISLEILTKAVSLMLILAGYASQQMALAQAMTITLIIIEVAIMVVGVGIVLCVHKRAGSIDAAVIQDLKG